MATRPAVATMILLLIISTSCFAASVPPASVTVAPLCMFVLQRARDCTERAEGVGVSMSGAYHLAFTPQGRGVHLSAESRLHAQTAVPARTQDAEVMSEDEEKEDATTLQLFHALKGVGSGGGVAFLAPLASRATLLKANEKLAGVKKDVRPCASAPASHTKMSLGKGSDGFKFFSKFTSKLPGTLAAAWLGLVANFNGLGVGQNSGLNLNPLGVAPANAADWPPPKDGKKRVLFLLSDTGGGHKASARAIKGALDILYPGKFTCEIEDMWTDHGKWPFNQFVPGYQWMARNKIGNWMWKLLYQSSQIPPNRWLTGELAHCVNGRAFEAYMSAYEPDIVVSVHPLCQDVPLRILDRMGGGKRKVPFITVVTDLGSASTLWFHKGVDKCCVPGDVCEKIALRKGLKPQQIRKHGLPVRQGFWEAGNRRQSSAQTKAQLGLSNIPTVLVMGGGDGVGPMQEIAKNVGERLGQLAGEYQMVVVCGKNERVQKQVKDRSWPANVKVVTKGFVSNMDDWMVAADLMVTKAGPGTIAEASIVGLPCMLSGFLPGQEEGNVPYVIGNGYGDFSRDPKKIAAKVPLLTATKTGPEVLRQALLAALLHPWCALRWF